MVFDGPNRRIILTSSTITAAEIWSRWVDWLESDTNNNIWLPALRQIGGDDLGGGLSIPPYFFLLNNWRVRPMESNHTLTIDGNLFVDGGGDPVVPTLGIYNVLVKLVVPVQAQGISTSGTEVDVTAIASAVWDKLLADHQAVGSAGKALSTASSGGVDYNALAGAVWNEPLTGATHNTPTSAGRRLRQVSAPIILEGFVISSTNNSVTFDGEASVVNGSYDPSNISIVSGTGAGQTRLILEYNGTTKTALVDRNWRVNPDVTSEYIIVSTEGREHVNEGRAQGGTISTITLNANASHFDNAYNGQVVFIRSGTGEDQSRRVMAYNGTTKVATLERNWDVTPDTTSGYVMLPTSTLSNDCIAHAVWNAPIAGHQTAGTTGFNLQMLADVSAGNWKIQGTMMIFYKQDGSELFRYSLLDNNGNPSNQVVFERVKL